MLKSAVPVVRVSTSINIDKELWKPFKIACASNSKTVTVQMETLVRNWLNLHKVKATPTSKR
jgi:hypothetical protein